MTLEVLTEHQLEFLRLKTGCRDPSESTVAKIPHCWKSHVMDHIFSFIIPALYGKLFPNKTDAAMSCFNLLNSLGMVLSFALSSFLCTHVKLIIVFTSLILSTVCVILVVLHNDQKYRVHFKFWKPKRSRTRSNENVALS